MGDRIQKIKEFVRGFLNKVGIKKDNQLMLEEAREYEMEPNNLGDTLEFVPLQLIEAILGQEEVFQEFLNSGELFREVKKETCVEAISQYYSAIISLGYKIPIEQLDRAQEIGKLGKVSLNNETQTKQGELDESPMISISLLHSILSDDDTFNKFLKIEENREVFGDLSKDIYREGLNKLYKKLIRTNIYCNMNNANRLDFLNEDKNINRYGYIVSPDMNLNEDFEAAVMRDIPPDLNQIALAKAIYGELNKRVEYDPTFASQNQDLDIDFVNRIYNRSIEDINLDSSKLVCKTWAELYAHILNKNGIEAVVSGEGKHKYVTLLADNTLITAEGTNATYCYNDSTKFTDLTRAKLGLETAGFVGMNRDISDQIEEIDDILIYKKNKITFKEQIEELKKSMDFDEDITKRVFNIDSKNIPAQIVEKLNVINNLVTRSKMGTMDTIAYCNQLIYFMFDKEETQYIVQGYVSEGVSDAETTYTRLIAIGSNDETTNIGYKYLKIDSTEGLQLIEETELIENIKTGKTRLLNTKKEESPLNKVLFGNNVKKGEAAYEGR